MRVTIRYAENRWGSLMFHLVTSDEQKTLCGKEFLDNLNFSNVRTEKDVLKSRVLCQKCKRAYEKAQRGA